jgi:hypothetical protein
MSNFKRNFILFSLKGWITLGDGAVNNGVQALFLRLHTPASKLTGDLLHCANLCAGGCRRFALDQMMQKNPGVFGKDATTFCPQGPRP